MNKKQLTQLLKTDFGNKVICSNFDYRNEVYMQGFILDRPLYRTIYNDTKMVMTLILKVIKENKDDYEIKDYMVECINIEAMEYFNEIKTALFITVKGRFITWDSNLTKMEVDTIRINKIFENIEIMGEPRSEVRERIDNIRRKVGDTTKYVKRVLEFRREKYNPLRNFKKEQEQNGEKSK